MAATEFNLDLAAAPNGNAIDRSLLNEFFGNNGFPPGLVAVTTFDLSPVVVSQTIDGTTYTYTFTGPNNGVTFPAGITAPSATDVYFVAPSLLHTDGDTLDVPALRITPLTTPATPPDILATFFGSTYATAAAFYAAVASAQAAIDAYYASLSAITFDTATIVGFDPTNSATFANLTFGVGETSTAAALTTAAIQAIPYSIAGTAFDDTIEGFSNVSNTIAAGVGDDTIIATAATDDIDGGTNTAVGDTVDYSRSNAGVSVDLTLGTGAGGFAAGDVLAGIENVVGSNFADTLIGNGSANVLDGLGGTDKVSYASSAGPVTIDLGISSGTAGDASGDVYINVETFEGSASDDTFIAGAAAHAVSGLAGNDTVSYASSTQGVTVNLDTGTGTGGWAAGDTLTDIESVVGSAFNDTFIASLAANTLTGGAGIDTLSYAASTSGVQVLLSEAGPQTSSGFASGDILSGIENVIGTSFNDTIGGDSAVNNLQGGAGAGDILSYAGSNAGVTVNLATNAVSGGHAQGDIVSGFEGATGSAFADTLTGSVAANTISGGDGNDTIQGGAGADTLDGGLDVDTLSYAASAAGVTVDLAAGTATGGDATGDIISNFENVVGSNVNDIIVGSSAVNNLQGGLGVDTLSYAASAAGVSVNLATSAVSGGDAAGDTIGGFENVTGSNFNDVLTGNAAVNVITGGDGDDTIEGGAGADTLSAGIGNDTVSYAGSTAGVTVNLVANTATGGDATGDVISGFESVIGSNFSDTIVGSSVVNTLQGGSGVDTLSYASSDAGVNVNLSTDTVSGGHAAGDTIIGFENVVGSNFNDTLVGSALANNIQGGTGIDTLSYAASTLGVTVNLALATAQVSAGDASGDVIGGVENLVGSGFADTLTGSSAANTISGGDGNDIIQGGAGADTLDGGADSDTLSYAASAVGVTVDLAAGTATGGDATGDIISNFEIVVGSNVNDIIVGSSAVNTLQGGLGIDTLSYAASAAGVSVDLATSTVSGGDAAGDTIGGFENVTGSNFNDVLTGNAGANVLTGATGDDVLAGGAGADNMSGGGGRDTVTYASSSAGVQVNLGLATAQVSTGDAAGDIISGVENVTGSAFVDTLTGDAGNNVLVGRAGADTLNGGVGVSDTVDYSQDGGAGGVIVNLSTASITVGPNTVLAGRARDTHGATDTLSGVERVIGTAQADHFRASAGDDTFVGGAGDDTFDGASVNSLTVFDSEFDAVDYRDEGGGSGVTVNVARNTSTTATDSFGNTDTLIDIEAVRGTQFVDTFTNAGTGENAQFTGYEGADILIGNAGNSSDEARYDRDWFYGGVGGAVMNTSGASIASLSAIYGATFALMGITPSTDTIDNNRARDGFGDTDVLSSIERMRGGAFDDVYIGQAGVSERFRGMRGNDFFDGGGTGDNDWIMFASDSFTDSPTGVGTGGAVVNLSASTVTLSPAMLSNLTLGTNGAIASIAGLTARDGYGTFDRFVNVENARGTALNDVLIGDASDNRLQGDPGNDYLFGGAGSDRFIGDAGNDVFDGAVANESGSDSDRVLYADEFLLQTSGVLVNMSGTTQTIGAVVLAAGTARDLSGNTDTLIDIEIVVGSRGTDTIIGGNVGNDGFEGFVGINGNDTLTGGTGFDDVRYDSDLDYGGVSGGTGLAGVTGVIVNLSAVGIDYNTDTIVDVAAFRGRDLFGGTDTLSGIEASVGTAFGDFFYGGAENNRFRGLKGDDRIDGAAGFDTVSYRFDDTYSGGAYSGAKAGIVANLSGASVTVGGNTVAGGTVRDVWGNTDTIFSIEGVEGSAFGDHIVGSNNVGNVLQGLAGADILIGRGGEDIFDGGAGNDVLDGTADASDAAPDTDYDIARYSSDGNGNAVTVNLRTGQATDSFGNTDILIDIEEVEGSAVADVLIGGNIGNNSFEGFYGLRGADRIDGGSGFDRLNYARDFFFGGNLGINADLAAGTVVDGFGDTDIVRNIENVTGTRFVDVIRGDGGNNNLRGYGGNDILDGRDGIDEADYNRDAFNGGPGAVTVNLQTGTATDGFGNTDTLISIENARGTNGNDTLTGSNGNNRLRGQGGNDVLIGGVGADELVGGTGADFFRYLSPNDGGIAGSDTIVDFSNADGDRIQVQGSAFGGLIAGALAASAFQSVASGGATLATTRFVYNTTDFTLKYDANGSISGGEVTLATFSSNVGLTTSSLAVI